MDSLRSQYEMISLESESGLASAAQAAKRLPHYFDNVKAYMAKSILDPVLSLFDSSTESWFTRGLNKRSYIDLQDLEVACPLGFTGDLLSYSKDLLESARAASEVLNKNISPFNEWLEQKLGDPETLNSSVGSKVTDYVDLKVENHWQKLHHHFTKDSRELATTKYKHLVRRNADWTEIVKNLSAVDHLLNKEYHQRVMSHTNRLTENLDQLLSRIEHEPDKYKLSGQVIKTLAERSYDTAKSVEYYALVRFKRRELETAMLDIKNKIEASV